jgi:hypothetical protein
MTTRWTGESSRVLALCGRKDDAATWSPGALSAAPGALLRLGWKAVCRQSRGRDRIPREGRGGVASGRSLNWRMEGTFQRRIGASTVIMPPTTDHLQE